MLANEIGILPEEDMKDFFAMLSDRNEASHTYDVELAEEIAKRIPKYWHLIDMILNKLSSSLE